MKRYIKTLGKLGIAALGAVVALSAWLANPATIVHAIDEPESVSLDGILIFQDLLEEDDFLAIVPYEIPFTEQPDENIDQSFIFRMMSVNATTELGTTLANPAYDGGYGSGVVSFRFAASENITWGEAYVFRVQENPTYYPSPQYWDFTIGDSNYSTASDQAAALKAKTLDSATYLSTVFDVELTATSESGTTVLSTYGELYYLEVIPGLQSMCPELFGVNLENPDYTKRGWTYEFAEALTTKYAGTFIEDFMTGFGGLFEMESSTAMGFFSIFLFAILVGLAVWEGKASMLSAFTDGYTLLLLLMLMGIFPMVAAGGIAFASAVLGGVILLLNRA